MQPAMWDSAQFRPVAPLGMKHCRTCAKPMNARDQHARCQSCRNAGGYLANKYRGVCGVCRCPLVKKRPEQKSCSQACGAVAGHASRKKNASTPTLTGVKNRPNPRRLFR